MPSRGLLILALLSLGKPWCCDLMNDVKEVFRVERGRLLSEVIVTVHLEVFINYQITHLDFVLNFVLAFLSLFSGVSQGWGHGLLRALRPVGWKVSFPAFLLLCQRLLALNVQVKIANVPA